MVHALMRPVQTAFGRLAVLAALVAFPAFLKLSGMCAQLPLEGDIRAHDPSTIARCGNRYYIFSTGKGILTRSSPDLVHWTAGPPVFLQAPDWTTNAVPGFKSHFWAPDVIHVKGRYHLYYSVSTWGSQVSAIGLATNPTLDPADPGYQWTDQGIVIQSTNGLPYNTIDPGVLLDDNRNLWMVFGSFWSGIKLVRLDPATGKRFSPNSIIYSLAFHPAIEAASLLQHNGYFYLFVNWDACCRGVDSTYNIRVGRSRLIIGPYLDRDGNNMMSDSGTMFFETSGRRIGPGHAAIFAENGVFWCSYHYYDGNDNGVAKLGIGQIEWTEDGWPGMNADWCAFYTFEAGARDHQGEFDGSLRDGAAIVNDAERGAVLSLDGSGQHVRLPVSVANGRTFATWLRWKGGEPGQHLFDFGSGNNRYLYLTPKAKAGGKLRFGITPDRGRLPEQVLDAPDALPSNSWSHVAVTLDGARGLLYLGGQPVATNSSLTYLPHDVLAHSNYLGRSQSPEPGLRGEIDSFRVYGHVLAPEEIARLAGAHPSLSHRWSFSTSATDSVGTAHGLLAGGAQASGGFLSLDGSPGAFVNLPGGLVSAASAVTIEFWATFGTNGPWARVFDFGATNGDSGRRFLMFSPHTSLGTHRFSVSTDSGIVDLDCPGELDGRALHVACVYDPGGGFMGVYTNGRPERVTSSVAGPLSGVSPDLFFLGRSLFAADAWLQARIDEFRIYHCRLTEEEIATSFAAGPNHLAVPANLSATSSRSGLSLGWPAYAVGFVPEAAVALEEGAIWTRIPDLPLIDNGRHSLTVPIEGGSQFFRLRLDTQEQQHENLATRL